MRIAVVADIHGNLPALEAVQSALRADAPDLVVNLGDHLSGPLWARETADLLMTLDWVHIRGNHDRQLLDRPVGSMGLSDRAAIVELDDRHKAWLGSLPATLRLDAGVFLCHGTPTSDLTYFLEEVLADGLVRVAPPTLVRERLGSVAEPFVLCGHTHVPRVVALGSRVVANPGSVGLPAYDDIAPVPHVMEAGSPEARYALADLVDGAWAVSLKAVDYDWSSAASRASAGGRADWACALATGRALRS